jgi:hypothetical protein
MNEPPLATRDSVATVDAPPIDMTKSEIRYVNFCRVTGTPEEVIIDLGLQTAEDASHDAWEALQRVTLDFYTTKRLVFALQSTFAQYEATFGVVETNVDKRLLPGASSDPV